MNGALRRTELVLGSKDTIRGNRPAPWDRSPLVTAKTPGYAMKAPRLVVGGVAVYPTGAILGKALQPLTRGRAVIRVLVMLR